MNELEVTLGKFNNSMNFIFGLTGGDMDNGMADIENNPYVSFVALERRNGRNFYSNVYEFERCGLDHMKKFILDHALDWYSQPLCFKDRDDVRIHNSWIYEDYSFPVITRRES